MRPLVFCGAAALAAFLAGNTGAGLAAATAPITGNAPATPSAAQVCRERAGSQRVLIWVFAGPRTSARPGTQVPRSEPGVQVADSMRQEMAKAMCREYFPVPPTELEMGLKTSGYSTDTALSPQDLKLLAAQAAANIVVFGTVKLDGRAWTVTPLLMDPTNERITQPLPSASHPSRVLFAVREVINEMKPALAVMPNYIKCRNATRERKHQEAIALGNAIIAAYPQSTMGRICRPRRWTR
jgi:hypothetical protein